MTLTAVKPGSTITGSAANMVYTTAVVGVDGSTRTVTAIAQAQVSTSLGQSIYTLVETAESGTSTIMVAGGVEPANTSPSAGLQNDAFRAGGGRNVVLGMALLISLAFTIVL